MAPSDRGGKQGDGADKPQDPLVARLRPDPSQPPTPVLVLEGLLGDSDRPGFRRLYFARELDVYAEFRSEDVVDIEPIGEDRPPFVGEAATRVRLRRDAPVDYTRSRVGEPSDPFDLDVRLGPIGAVPREPPQSFDAFCPGPTLDADCPGPTREIDCQTNFTCVTCGATCQATVCHGATCNDATICGGLTRGCHTHTPTCAVTCVRTCTPTCPPTCSPTCAATCAHTCAHTCAGGATCITCPTGCAGGCRPTEIGGCFTHLANCTA